MLKKMFFGFADRPQEATPAVPGWEISLDNALKARGLRVNFEAFSSLEVDARKCSAGGCSHKRSKMSADTFLRSKCGTGGEHFYSCEILVSSANPDDKLSRTLVSVPDLAASVLSSGYDLSLLKDDTALWDERWDTLLLPVNSATTARDAYLSSLQHMRQACKTELEQRFISHIESFDSLKVKDAPNEGTEKMMYIKIIPSSRRPFGFSGILEAWYGKSGIPGIHVVPERFLLKEDPGNKDVFPWGATLGYETTSAAEGQRYFLGGDLCLGERVEHELDTPEVLNTAALLIPEIGFSTALKVAREV